MTDDLITAATLIGAVGCGLVGGLMFAFSTSVMPALGRRPAPQGIAAMQAMNSTILNPVFGLVFGGTAIVCAALAVSAPFTTDQPGAGWRALGALLYLIGTFGVTMVVNVPMNDALDAADPTSAEGARLWHRYLGRWTAWNHLRTVAATAAATSLAFALHG
ncbi:MAG TPA: anthrone oxygenase family protein [Acidimicrobiales bacterium]